MGLAQKAVVGVVWSSLAELIAKVISPLTFLALTRILSPKDFGIVAVATTILMFINLICDMGTSKILIQLKCEENDFEHYCNVSFWLNIIIGIFLFGCVFMFSGCIASFYSQPDSSDVIKFMSVQIILYSFSTVQNALKNRMLDYKSLFIIKLITVGVPGLVSIPIAFMGGGLWAIVSGSVCGALLSTIALWYSSNWRPKFEFKFKYLKIIISKSIWNTLEQLFVWVPICMDTYLISKFNSTDDLGLYTTARSLFSSVSSLFIAPILPVLFSSLSKACDKLQLIRITLFSQKIIFFMASFMAIIFFSYDTYIVKIIFNSKWDGISIIVGIIFLLMGLEFFYSAIIESLRATGHFKELAVNTIVSTMITIPFLYYGSSHGIIIYTIVRCVTLYFNYFGVFYFSNRYNDISIRKCIKNNCILLYILLFSIPLVAVIKFEFSTGILNFVILTVNIVLSLLIYFLSERKFIFSILKPLINKFR